MRLENMKEEFPKMPDDIREMIENEVARQIKIERPDFTSKRLNDSIASDNSTTANSRTTTDCPTNADHRRSINRHRSARRLSARKITAAAIASVMVLGSTVFAGTELYRIYKEKVGNYGVETSFGTDSTSGSAYGKAPDELPVVKITNNYLPEGMVFADNEKPGTMFYESNPYKGGISMAYVTMDDTTTQNSLKLLDTNVTYSEELTIAGHDAVYLKREAAFDKVFYVVYPEVWCVLQVYAGQDTTKEEAVRVIENTELVPTGEVYKLADAYTWSDFAASKGEGESIPLQLTASKDDMQNTHRIGESFHINTVADTAEKELVETKDITATVTNVQVADDLSLLGDSEYIDTLLTDAAGADGRLLPNTIQYIKSGNGIDTLDEIIQTEEVAQKLVDVTVEYTNTGNTELRNVLFMGFFTGIEENGDTFSIYDRASHDGTKEWDCVSCTSAGGFGEMQFYDTHAGERKNNYISVIKPGETITVHMAQIINEDELKYMYLDLSPSSADSQFTEQALAQGYVDIRQ
ncbi:MAG: DUF4367 domain-containing protein [Eubacteriales bacterium]|nr:DUF4367 domain-containing protein [Eubacteriales bacterium]